MGRNKALIAVDGVPMARRVADAMAAGGAEVVVLVGGPPSVGQEIGLEVVEDRWPGEGPLAGIASAAGWAEGVGASRLLVAACDQPNLQAGVFERLLSTLAGDPGERMPPAGAVVVTPDGRRHPFPSAWHVAAAPRLRDLVEHGSRRADGAFSLGVVTIDAGIDAVVDIDRPEDLPPPT